MFLGLDGGCQTLVHGPLVVERRVVTTFGDFAGEEEEGIDGTPAGAAAMEAKPEQNSNLRLRQYHT